MRANPAVPTNNRAIADRYALTQVTMGKWRGRFLKHRMARLYDELRSGRPRSIEKERVAALICKTLYPKAVCIATSNSSDSNRI